jgi:DNA end-binding protein Ku
MPRALQSITLSFGLVSIPANIYTATGGSERVSFKLLHECGSRVVQQYRCVEEEKDVPRSELVKGYEFEKDKFVVFTKEELKALEETRSEYVTIDQFLPLTKIDPIYFDATYFLGPDKGGSKPYGLLLEAMRRSGKVAVGRWATRGKQYLVAIRPGEDGLIMQQLHYANEVRKQSELEIPKVEVKQQELALAEQLIASISVDEWQPDAFKDEVQARIQEQIQRKIEGKAIVAPEAPTAPGGAQVIDLMEALRASLKDAPGRAPKPARKSAARDEAPKPARRPAAKRAVKKAA